MLNLDVLGAVWRDLEIQQSQDETIPSRELDYIRLSAGYPILLIDRSSKHHFLVPIKDSSDKVTDKKSAGVHITPQQWGANGEYKWHVDVSCENAELNYLFDMMVLNALQELEKDSTRIGQTVQIVLNKWRNFLEKPPSSLPPENELMGIFGELFLLRKLSQLNSLAIKAWVGPQGIQHDFIYSQNAVEVKTTRQKTGLRLRIHGVEQLAPPLDGNLYLYVLRLEKRPGEGESIPDLITSLISLGVSSNEIYLNLIQAGLHPEMIGLCGDLKLETKEELMFHVKKDFPSITVSSFVDGKLPLGVTGLDYEIDVVSLPTSLLSKTEAKKILEEFTKKII